MEYRTSGNTRGFIWIMDIAAGWALFVCCIVSNWVMFILIDGYFEGDIKGLRDDEE